MVFSPFGLVVMHQYMKKINNTAIEALRLETNSVIIILLKGVVPQVKTCIMAVFLFTFAECYNMLEQPMLFLKEDSLKTLPVFISQADKYDGSVLFPAAVIYMVPVFLLYLSLGKNLGERPCMLPVIICTISILFFGIMAFLTFKARDIHEEGLPHVKYQKLEIIPKDAIHNNNQVFVIKTMVKNGEERTFAEARAIVPGEETKEGYKPASGIDIWDNVIIFSDRELKDGQEVVIIK